MSETPDVTAQQPHALRSSTRGFVRTSTHEFADLSDIVST